MSASAFTLFNLKRHPAVNSSAAFTLSEWVTNMSTLQDTKSLFQMYIPTWCIYSSKYFTLCQIQMTYENILEQVPCCRGTIITN